MHVLISRWIFPVFGSIAVRVRSAVAFGATLSDTATPAPYRRYPRIPASLMLAATLALSGCASLPSTDDAEVNQNTFPPNATPTLPSAEALRPAQKSDVIYAQQTLKTLGFALGRVDGIWGPRSAAAIQEFERKFGLESANGLLSELNLYMLETISNTRRDSVALLDRVSSSHGITAKLDRSNPLQNAPQLVILDKSYVVFAKPNPYSEKITDLVVGEGVYVLDSQDGWFEVESRSKQRGFVRAD